MPPESGTRPERVREWLAGYADVRWIPGLKIDADKGRLPWSYEGSGGDITSDSQLKAVERAPLFVFDEIGRAAHERRVVSRALGGATLGYLASFAYLASKGPVVTVMLTRLGGRALDPTDNLPASMKYVIDTVAMMMGFDDGPASPLRFKIEQEPGGPCGVRIVMEADGTKLRATVA